MNLIIDSGNTSIKLAVFDNYKLLDKLIVFEEHLDDTLFKLKNTYPIDGLILSSVGQTDILKLLESFEFKYNINLNHSTPIPFNNKYETPKTLGVDRLALVSAASKTYPNQNVLIIDAGTCITYDFIDKTNNYHGGAISPGITMRYKSLNQFTAKLPLFQMSHSPQITGKNTETSIHSGVVNGISIEIDGVIAHYKQLYEHLTVILTGGDAKFLSDQLKNSIFANSNFLLEGLNFILEYNKNND